MSTDLLERLETAVIEDEANGIYRCRRDIFTDPELFELEMKHIFEGNWIFLAHESQIPNKNDYFTTYMGRTPIFIARNKDGVPLCGVPYHSAEPYIAKLLKAGHKVAICEQGTPDPKSPKLMPRQIVRVITPGTVGEVV